MKMVLGKARFSLVLYLAFFDKKMCNSGAIILRTARKLKHRGTELMEFFSILKMTMPLDSW